MTFNALPYRGFSLALALGISLTLLLYPYLLGQINRTAHIALPILLLGVSASFVHGFGYRPENKLWRALFSAPSAWALITIGAFGLLLRSH